MINDPTLNSVFIIASGVLATMFTRFFPFFAFHGKRGEHPLVLYLSAVLPYAAISLLVVYALKNTVVFRYPYAIPELVSLGLIWLLHKFFKNSLISILGGTVVYMVLIQTVF